LLRLAKGKTTIDMRGAIGCGVDAAIGAPAVGERGPGQSHQATIAMTSAAEAAAMIVASLVRPRRGAERSTLAAGKAAMASGDSA
jgi:hypothetical protein